MRSFLKIPLLNIMQCAHQRHKSTGVVTSAQFAQVTPAGFTSHNIDRNNFEQIAREMILDSKLEAAMGCGNPLAEFQSLITGSTPKRVPGVAQIKET